MRTGEHWSRLHREVVQPLSLEALKAGLDKSLSSTVGLGAGPAPSGDKEPPDVPAHQNHPVTLKEIHMVPCLIKSKHGIYPFLEQVQKGANVTDEIYTLGWVYDFWWEPSMR